MNGKHGTTAISHHRCTSPPTCTLDAFFLLGGGIVITLLLTKVKPLTCFDFISVVGGRGQGIWICKTLDVGLHLGFGNGKHGTRELEI